MFSGMKAPVSAPVRSPAPVMMSASHASFSMGKAIAIILSIVIVVGLGGFAFWYFVIRMPAATTQTPTVRQTTEQQPVQNAPVQPQTQTQTQTETETQTPPAQEASSSATEQVLPPPITEPPAGVNIPSPESVNTQPASTTPETSVTTTEASTVDTDGDGLTDSREIELGLDPNKADTDGDGLSDGDEVLKYDTNPLNPDTDKDGFSDAQEIKNGYNPRGEGKCANAECTAN